MANFSPRPDTRNMRSLFFSFLRSVAGGGRSTPVHSVQTAPTMQLPPANDLENDALSFVEHFGLDDECFRQLLSQPPDVARAVMAGFQPRPDTHNPQGLFISYLRSVAAASNGSKGGAKGGAKGSALSPIGAFGSWPRSTQPIAVRAAPYDRPPAPQAQGKGPRGVPKAFVTSVSEEELLDFALAWQLDQGCLDFLQTQDAETQRFVVNNFQPKEGTANVGGLFMSYVNSLVRAGKAESHEFYRDAADVARAAVLAAPLFLEHWIRLAIVLSHPALEMPREAGMLVRQAMLLNDTHYCLRGLERMLLPSVREAGIGRPPDTNLLERALGGVNATRRATSTSREAVLWGRMMRRAQRRCGSPEGASSCRAAGVELTAAASKEGFKSWMLYEALLRRRGWLIAALGVCLHLEELYLADGRPEALRVLGEAVQQVRKCRDPLESLLFHSHAGFWGADLYAADFEHRAPSARELLSEDWLREQEAATYEGGRDLVAGHMQTLAFSYSSVYRTMVVSGTAMAAKRVLRLTAVFSVLSRPQHAAERLPLGKAAPVKVFLMVTNAERNRAEIASLRHEISSLLQTNGQLHQHLGQLNSFLPDSSLAANSQGGASAEANLRRSRDNSEAPRPYGHMRSDPGASCLSSPRGAAALASLLRERDDLQQRLQATELARCAAQQRRATAEAALRRCTEDLEWQRKRIAAQEAGQDQPFGEAELLRKQLREAQDKLAELDVILSARSERVRVNERDYAEARVEFDALSVANDAIQKELEATRSRIASEQQGCQAAESELSEFQARMRAEEVEFAAEVETLGSRRSSLETSLRESSANLADMEAEVSAARAQSLGLRAQLEVLQAARDEIVSQEHQATIQQRAETVFGIFSGDLLKDGLLSTDLADPLQSDLRAGSGERNLWCRWLLRSKFLASDSAQGAASLQGLCSRCPCHLPRGRPQKQASQMEDSDETNSEAGESSPTSSSPSDTNPLRGPSALRKRMRQLVRPLYERRWGNADMVWNSTRSLLCREDAVAEGETYKALSSAKREELADALFNQAYSCLMAMTLWGGEGGVERTHAALRQNPLLANSLWCACRIRWHAQLKDKEETKETAGETEIHQDKRAEERATMTEPRETQQGVTIKREDSPDWTDPTLDAEWKTPPDLDFAGEGSNADKSPTWTDPAQDEPWTTPHDLTLEGEDEDGGVSRPPTDYLPKNMLKIYTPADEAFMTIFHGVTMASLHREWQIPPKGEDAEEDEVVGDSAGENVAQAEDDLAQKVLRALQSEDEMEEIAVEMYEVQPNGPSIICPSAAPDFHGCTNPVKVEDCVSGDTPAPAPSPPAPQAPAPTRSLPHTAASLTMRIVNKEWSDGVVFCRGPQDALSTVYLDAALTQSVHNSAVDCSEGTGNDEYGSGVPDLTTLCMGLKKGESTLGCGNWPSGTCWFQDIASNQQHSLSMGPQYQSQVEFTNLGADRVSGGVTMNYTDGNGKKTDVVALPGKFTGSLLKIQPAPGIGFPTVLADKHVYGECNCPVFSPENPSCNTDACYTGCPGSLADNPCGQHRCRQWYAKSYETSESYCGWLYANNAETYCWAMDEAWRSCCGHIKNQPAYPSGVWWTHAVGCTDKLVQGVPTNPILPRAGGVIDTGLHLALANCSKPWPVERLEAKAESLAAEALDLSHRHEQAKVSFQAPHKFIFRSPRSAARRR
eukprot:s1754_g11.t5